ncbi:MAG: preprotein translocase subunit SecE [Firmicutes bacterium]|nr:preprotein translocase subunit SecE [Bacillota bacterium]
MKKEKIKKEKKNGFLKETRNEMKKVSWPNKKDVFKYTLATLIFCLVVVGFFQLLNLGLSFIKGMFA